MRDTCTHQASNQKHRHFFFFFSKCEILSQYWHIHPLGTYFFEINLSPVTRFNGARWLGVRWCDVACFIAKLQRVIGCNWPNLSIFMERLNSIVVLGSPCKSFVILLLRTTQNNEVGTKCVLTNIYILSYILLGLGFRVEDIASHTQKHKFFKRQGLL